MKIMNVIIRPNIRITCCVFTQGPKDASIIGGIIIPQIIPQIIIGLYFARTFVNACAPGMTLTLKLTATLQIELRSTSSVQSGRKCLV